ncbi:MAG: glycosyltransferase [Pseudomonadota bacterium]
MIEDTRGQDRTLVAIVVTYNRLEKLQSTIGRLLDASDAVLQRVLVIDNASTDGTAAWLAQQIDPRLTVYSNQTNTGGAGGFALGIDLATRLFDPDWLVVMDDDARPAPGALEAFSAMNVDAHDAVAAAVYYPDGKICEMNRPSRNPFQSARLFLRSLFMGRNGFHISHDAYNGGGQHVDVTSFVGFFVSRAGVEKAGLPDASLFVYGDDGIYTLGLSQKGGRIWFAPSLRFEHDCATIQNKRFFPMWKVYYYHRNLLIMYRQAAGWLFWPACLLILPRWILSARHHKEDRDVFWKLMSRAIRDGVSRKTNVPHADILDICALQTAAQVENARG